jgi:hypothetical protein
VRELNPVNFRAGGYMVVDDVYTDYDGDEAYGDYQVVTFQPDLEQDPIPFGSTIRGFEAGLGTFEYEADPAFDPHCALSADADAILPADSDRNGYVDLRDVGHLQRSFSGADNAVQQSCP